MACQASFLLNQVWGTGETMRKLPSSPRLLLLPKYCLPSDNNNISHSFKTEFASYLCRIKTFRAPKAKGCANMKEMNFIQVFLLFSVTGLLPTTPMSFRYSYLLCVTDTWRDIVMWEWPQKCIQSF